jgi:hypothetical protein
MEKVPFDELAATPPPQPANTHSAAASAIASVRPATHRSRVERSGAFTRLIPRARSWVAWLEISIGAPVHFLWQFRQPHSNVRPPHPAKRCFRHTTKELSRKGLSTRGLPRQYAPCALNLY